MSLPEELFALLSSLLLDHPIQAIALAPHALEEPTHAPFALYDSVNLVIPIKALYAVYPVANSHVKAWQTTEPRTLDAASRIVLIQSPEHLTALNCRKRLLRPVSDFKQVKVGLMQEYFDAIQAGDKTWEGRIDREIYSSINKGDQILFHSNTDPSRTVLKTVLQVQRHPDFASMLQGKHGSFIPGSTLDTAINTYLSLPGYAAATQGAIAFQLSPLSPSTELLFNTALLSIHGNSKAAPLWAHRRWLLSNFGLKEDLSVPRKACEGYKRNYAAWTHRLLLSSRSCQSREELDNALEWFSRNAGDWSCANFLLRLIEQQQESKVWDVVEENVRRYGRESSWLALRALAVGREQEGVRVCEELLSGGMSALEGKQRQEAIKWAKRTKAFLLWQGVQSALRGALIAAELSEAIEAT